MTTMIDAEDGVAGTEKDQDSLARSRITWGFNAWLFAFQLAVGLFHFVIRSGGSLPGVIISTLLDSIRFGLVVLLAACFVGAFWRRFVGPIFGVRAIAYREAVAIILIGGLVLVR